MFGSRNKRSEGIAVLVEGNSNLSFVLSDDWNNLLWDLFQLIPPETPHWSVK